MLDRWQRRQQLGRAALSRRTASRAPTSSRSKSCCPTARSRVLGGLDPEPIGFDLRGAFVGSEGTMGIATKIAVRLTPNPPTVRTMLIDFESVADAAATVSGIIAAGVVPAAIEMMDAAR